MITISGSAGKSTIIEAIKAQSKVLLFSAYENLWIADYYIPETVTVKQLMTVVKELHITADKRIEYIIIYTVDDGKKLKKIAEQLDKELRDEYLGYTLIFVHK
jgi:hypothetical protein